MAGATVSTKLAGMPVVILVTGDAVHRRVHKGAIQVAGFTLQLEMRPGKLESGPGVIINMIRPRRGNVALPAVNGKLTSVDIRLEMASGAEAWDPHPLAFEVAGFAFQVFMAADQVETRELVREESICPARG